MEGHIQSSLFDWSGPTSTTNSHPSLPEQLRPNYLSNISSYFRRPTRISKISSRGNSPRSLRRRTTTASTHVPSRQKSMTDERTRHYPHSIEQAMVGLESRVRPMSWHPTTLERPYFAPTTYTMQSQSKGPSPDYLGTTFTGYEATEAVTPLSHPFAAEPFVQDAFTPLEELSTRDFNDRYAYLDEFSADKSPFRLPQDAAEQFAPSTQHFFLDEVCETQKQSGYFVGHLPPNAAGQIAVPHVAGHSDLQSEHQKVTAGADELIGMGLYDAPSPLPPTMPPFGGIVALPYRASLGKGLKLEETFEPTTTEYDDDDDADGSEDDASNSYQAQPPNQTYLSLRGHSFFFEQDGPRLYSFSQEANAEANSWCRSGGVSDHGWI